MCVGKIYIVIGGNISNKNRLDETVSLGGMHLTIISPGERVLFLQYSPFLHSSEAIWWDRNERCLSPGNMVTFAILCAPGSKLVVSRYGSSWELHDTSEVGFNDGTRVREERVS